MGHADRKAISKKITNATTDTQIFTAPWRIRRRYFIKKLILTNENAAIAIVKFFDKDTASATPPVRGDNANAPLLEFIVPVTTTITLEDVEMPCEWFGSGLVANSSVNNVVVMCEVEED